MNEAAPPDYIMIASIDVVNPLSSFKERIMRMRRTLSATATIVMFGAIGAFSVGSASASTSPCPDGRADCSEPGWFSVSGSTGNLAVQGTDAVNNVIGWIPNGAPVEVGCQRNDGSTDPYDGLYSHTWDYVLAYFNNAWKTGWVYDHYITTAAQDANGWSVTDVCDFTNNPGA